MKYFKWIIKCIPSIFETFKGYFYAAAFTSVFAAGWYVNGAIKDLRYTKLVNSYQNAVIKAKEDAEEFREERQVLLDKIANTAAVEVTVVETEIVYVDREVIKYVTDPNTTNCRVDAKWVHLHNYAAIGGKVADTPSRADATTNEAISVITKNYEMCRINSIKFARLQDWVNQLTKGE